MQVYLIFLLTSICWMEARIISEQLFLKQQCSMFYQQIPKQLYFTFLPSPPSPPNPNNYIHILATALAKSVRAYSQSYREPSTEPEPQKNPEITQSSRKKVPSRVQMPLEKEESPKQSDKNCQPQSQKASSCRTIAECKSKMEGNEESPPLSLGASDEAVLPKFQLTLEERSSKLQFLLSRRVEGWRVERARKRSSKITYNWC